MGFNATIKRVDFEYTTADGMAPLAGLRVLDVSSKVYEHYEDEPLWGVESLGKNWTIEEINLQWGIISSEASRKFGDGIRTFRGGNLPLPLTVPSIDGGLGNGDTLVS